MLKSKHFNKRIHYCIDCLKTANKSAIHKLLPSKVSNIVAKQGRIAADIPNYFVMEEITAAELSYKSVIQERTSEILSYIEAKNASTVPVFPNRLAIPSRTADKCSSLHVKQARTADKCSSLQVKQARSFAILFTLRRGLSKFYTFTELGKKRIKFLFHVISNNVKKVNFMEVVIVLGLSKTNDAQALVNANTYCTDVLASSYFATADFAAQITKVQTAAEKLQAVLMSTNSNTKTDDTKTARMCLDKELKKLKRMVENVANDPSVSDTDRITIVHSAGMSPKTQTNPKQRVFAVNNAEVSGSLCFVAAGGVAANEWQYTLDTIGFTNRVSLPSTTKARTEASGFTPGAKVACFHKAIVANTATDWEGPIIITIL